MTHRRTITHLEIEVKLPVADLLETIRRLRRLGATCAGRVLERNTLFDTPQSDFRRCGRLLRLRVLSPARRGPIGAGKSGAVITSKAPAPGTSTARKQSANVKFKEKSERELPVHAPHHWSSVLKSLGLLPGFHYEKFRTSFRLPGLHLDLDETPVGTFLELEGTPRQIDEVAGALGFSRRDYIRATYWELYVASCRQRGRPPRNMLFDA